MSENVWLFYEKWIAAKEYKEQSPIENGLCESCKKAIEKITGKKQFSDIEDYILDFASEAEKAGFSNGFRLGVLFMGDIMKGGAEL